METATENLANLHHSHFREDFQLLLAFNEGEISSQNCALGHTSLLMRKPAFCICENKDADQLRGNHEADQRLCFRYLDSTIPLLPKYEILSL